MLPSGVAVFLQRNTQRYNVQRITLTYHCYTPAFKALSRYRQTHGTVVASTVLLALSCRQQHIKQYVARK